MRESDRNFEVEKWFAFLINEYNFALSYVILEDRPKRRFACFKNDSSCFVVSDFPYHSTEGYEFYKYGKDEHIDAKSYADLKINLPT